MMSLGTTDGSWSSWVGCASVLEVAKSSRHNLRGEGAAIRAPLLAMRGSLDRLPMSTSIHVPAVLMKHPWHSSLHGGLIDELIIRLIEDAKVADALHVL